MKIKNPTLPLTFLFFLVFSSLSAQIRTNGVITGRIMDASTNLPVEYANIVLTDSLTHTMAGGVVSDSTGSFRIQNVKSGTYIVEYSFIGYKKQRMAPVIISQKKQKADLGRLDLYSSAVNMNEVTITAEKSMMINKIDRKVFNVQKDISAQTGTVIDMLQTIPSVSVDVDGNISLRGATNVTVLINGRPSVMSGSSTLDQMPASMIERIEVITNPSAKFRPDGTGGIINIILKKEKKAGMNGSLGVNAGAYDRVNTNLQLNYNTGKTNIFGSYGFRQDYRVRSGKLSSQTIDTALNKSSYLWQNSEGTSKMLSHLVRLGADWNITRKDLAGISGSWNYRHAQRNDLTANLYENDSLVPYSQFLRSLDGVENETGTGLKAYYEHTFNREKEHQLKIDFDYQHDAEISHDNWTNEYQVPAYPQTQDHTDANNLQQEINFALNYTRPLWKDASLETGYEVNLEMTDQLQKVTHFDPDNKQWNTDTAAGTHFVASQPVLALYGIVSESWKKFRMMIGLRAEEALMKLEFRSLDATTKRDYFALYPTIHLGLASGKNEWQLNYSRRVNRPHMDDMNPVPEYRDPRNVYKGNPGLKPEDIHSFELGYAVQAKQLTFVPTLFYRYKVNGFTRTTSSLNDTVLITTVQNLSSDQSAGMDLSGSWQIAKIANLNFSASGFYNVIDASNLGYSSNKDAFSWNAKVNASFSITKTTMVQVNGQYRSKMLTPQGYRLASWGVNLGFRQDLWKKRLSIVATVSDLFDSQAWKTSVSTPVLVQESMRRRDARVIYGGVVLTLGKKNKKAKEPKFEFDNGNGNE